MSFLNHSRRLLKLRNLITSRRFNGYIVLVPEIGEDASVKNPLLQNDGLPEFNKLTIENCMAAIAKQTLDFESGVSEIEKSLTENESACDLFGDVFQPLEELGAPLDLTWGLSKTLYLGNNSLMPTKHYLAIHNRAKKARSTKFNSTPIYNAVKLELEKQNVERSDEDRRIMQKFRLEGELNGLDLSTAQRIEMDRHRNKLAQHRASFKQKVDFTTKRFSYQINDWTVLSDAPVELLEATTLNSSDPMKGPWRATLMPNVYPSIMEHCHDREVRWNVWQAYVGRGSGYGNKSVATSVHVEEIRSTRREIANQVGFDSFADMSMTTKMAGSVQNVQSMLAMLLQRAKPAQDAELEALHSYACERGFKGNRIELWDLPYWKKKQRYSLFNYREENFKEYFPLPAVLNGLFQLCEKLFKIVIKQRDGVSVWHNDVKFYDIFESHSSAPVAGFYIDPYVRSEDKLRLQQNTGWMVGIQNQSRITETRPLAALIFNFDAPFGDKPSHLTFREVKALFHRFGLALQHLLTRVNYSEVSGSSNIEWDAVEVSGHVLSHWLYNKSTIESISRHCDSEDKLPPQMFESLMQVHRHLAGTELCEQLYLSALDLELHHSKTFWLDVVKSLWPSYRSFPLDKADSHPCSFTDIFSEEWAAAYYSHVWSRVIAADVYSAFHEVQGDEQKTVDVGTRFRDTFLCLGGSCHPSEIFRKFRGRDPSPKALLSSLGLKKVKVDEN